MMPDLRPLRQHEAVLNRTEQALLRDTTAIYQALRVALLDILEQRGLPGLVAALSARTNATRQELLRRSSQATQESDQAATAFAVEELTRLAELLDTAPPDPATLTLPTQAARTAAATAETNRAVLWLAQVAGLLLARAAAMNATQTDPALAREQLLADEITDRASVWRSGIAPLTLAANEAVWGAANGSREIIYQRAAEQSGIRYRKQAIATIDRRTTSCCLNVHSQIRDIDKPFTLTGSPRYAGEMDNPPFHFMCRSSVVLYHEAMEQVGPTTRDLHAAAQAEIQARLMGGTSQTRRSQTALGELER